MKKLSFAVAALVAFAMPAAAQAQDMPYKRGTVWETSRIKIKPGGGIAYINFLSTTWKKRMEFYKQEGAVVGYHVLATNHARQGEPSLILITEWRDYMTTAQREALDEKFRKFSGETIAAAQQGNADRESIREQMGSTEYQELVLK